MTKTILLICPDLPYPPDQGSKIDMWGHVTFFHTAGWRVVLIVCSPGAKRTPGISTTDLPMEIDLHFVERNAHWSARENPDTVSMVQEFIDHYKPKVVFCEYAHFASLASALTLQGAKLWFRPHNFELAHAFDKALAYRPWLSGQGYSIPKALAWSKNLFLRPLHAFTKEQLMHRIADRLFFISPSDLHFMSWLYGGSIRKDWVLPFLERETIPVKDGKTPLDVIYVGKHDYADNPSLVGVRTLLHEVVPAVEAAMPGAFRFHVVGRGSLEQFGQYATKTVVIHDFVEDLSAFLQDIDVACIPLKLGWGCKLKMLEALASGLPVVGTLQTFRGVQPVEGAYYVCNTTQDYVEALRQLQDPNTRRHIAQVGKAAYTTWLAEGRCILQTALKDVENGTSASSSNYERCMEDELVH